MDCTDSYCAMTEAWWFERVKGTNAVKLFVESADKGEVEYVVPSAGSGNKSVDVSEHQQLTKKTNL